MCKMHVKKICFYRILYTLFFLGLVCLGDAAEAASLTVTSGADDGSAGTLRYAVGKAYSGQTISIEVDTVTLTSSLYIPKSLTLRGNPTTIRQAGTRRGITLSSEGSIWKFYDLVFTTDGVASDYPGLTNHGLLYLNDCSVTNCIGGGGIYNTGNITMRNCTVRDNTLSRFYTADAAGIHNGYLGIVTMHDCVVENNVSSTRSSGSGGGIVNGYILFMYGCTVRNNSSVYGGGLRLYSSSQTVLGQGCVIQDNTPDQIAGNNGYTLIDDGTNTVGTSPGRSSVALAGMASGLSPKPRATSGEADVIVVEKDLGNSGSTLYGEVREALSGDISGISGDLAVSLEGMNASLYNAFAYENVPLEDVSGNGGLEIEFTASWPRYVRYYAAFALAKEDGTGTEDVKNLTPEGYVLPERGIQFEIRPGQALPEGVNPPDFYETGEGLRTWRNTVEDNGSFDLNPDNGVVTFRVCSIRTEAETPTPDGDGTGGCDVGTGTVSAFSMLLFFGLPLIMKLHKKRWF